MGFTIDHGSPGLLMALLIGFGAVVAVIVVYFLLAAVKSAHDDVVEDEPES